MPSFLGLGWRTKRIASAIARSEGAVNNIRRLGVNCGVARLGRPPLGRPVICRCRIGHCRPLSPVLFSSDDNDSPPPYAYLRPRREVMAPVRGSSLLLRQQIRGLMTSHKRACLVDLKQIDVREKNSKNSQIGPYCKYLSQHISIS